MSDELRKAAEKTVEDFNSIPLGYALRNTSMYRNALMLAKAWLAEHGADDDEFASNEWLKTIGPLTLNNGCVTLSIDIGLVSFMHSGSSIFLRIRAPSETRGDVRRLASALGITLKEKS